MRRRLTDRLGDHPRLAGLLLMTAALTACSLIETYPELAHDPPPFPGGGAGGESAPTSSSAGGAPASSSAGGACTPMTTRSCYSGPDGTLGVGSCVAGVETCLPDGSGFGPCEGEIVPAPEDCSTTEDEDCDSVGKCGGEVLWSVAAGDGQPQQGLSVAADSAGNVWLTGAFDGVMDLGGGPLSSAGKPGIFVAKLDASGAHVHSLAFPGGTGRAAAVDGQGNVILAAECTGSVDFGGGVLPGGNTLDVCVVKFTAAGSYAWARRFGASSEQVPRGVAVGADGNIVVVGSFQGFIDFGGVPLGSSGGRDMFAVRLDAAGNHLWSKSFGGALDQVATAVAVEASGVMIVGTAAGDVDFGGGLLPPAGNDDIVVARLDLDANHLWAQRYGSPGDDRGLAVAIDGAGRVLVTGTFQGTTDFGDATLVAAGGEDMFLRKMDPGGIPAFTRRFGNGQDQAGLGVAVEPDGAILLTGRFAGAIDFGSGLLQSAGNKDVFLAKLDPGGGPLWSRRFGDDSDQIAAAIARSPAGQVVVAGSFAGAVDFGDGPHLTAGDLDLFLAAFAP